MMAVYSGDIDIYTFIQLDFFIPERIYIYMIYIYMIGIIYIMGYNPNFKRQLVCLDLCLMNIVN